MKKTLKIRLKRSMIGCTHKQKQSLITLGFRKTNQTIEVKNDPCQRGKIYKMQHYIEIVS